MKHAGDTPATGHDPSCHAGQHQEQTDGLTRREFCVGGLFAWVAAFVAQPARSHAQSHAPTAPDPSHRPGDAGLARRVEQAYHYLEAEMDRWTQGTVVYDDQGSGGAGFFPSNWMGDRTDITLDEACTESPKAGTTCIKFTYEPRGRAGWAGIYWAYPDLPATKGRPPGNWGDAPGRPLHGAKRLQGWIRGAVGEERVELKIGGINRPPYYDASRAFQDSFGPVSPPGAPRLVLTKEWGKEPFEIPIPAGVSLDSVIGGFVCVVSAQYNPHGCTFYLDEIAYDNADKDQLRLIRSYVPTADAGDNAIRNAAFLYDNIIALLAFLARGDDEGRRRAKILADGLVWAQANDRAYTDGRWRNAYSCGPLEDPGTKKARLPGWYQKDQQNGMWVEDRYAVSADTGNAAWTIIGLLAAHTRLSPGQKDSTYLGAALEAARWIEQNCRVNDTNGGYAGGFEGWDQTDRNPDGPKKLAWRSTEHNLDVFVAFSHLATLTGDAVWKERAGHARLFVLAMWQGGFFWTGVRDSEGTINKDAVPADVQTWAVLAMGHDPDFRSTIGWSGPPHVPSYIAWVESHCRVRSIPGCPNVAGYRFSDKGAGAWFEGAAHLAAVYQYLGNSQRAQAILEEIVRANPVDNAVTRGTSGAGGPVSTGGIYAACPDPTETGFDKEFAPGVVKKWTYPRRYHVGATAWFLLAAQGINPYWFGTQP